MLVFCYSKAFTVGPLTPARTAKIHEMGALLSPQAQPGEVNSCFRAAGVRQARE